MATALKYLDHGCLLNDSAHIENIFHNDNNKLVIILDQTIFYPQGGGQPYDQGTLSKNDGALFNVQEVRFVDGNVQHIGITEHGAFRDQDEVQLQVNEPRRLFNSRNHTAGHLIDIAMNNLGYQLKPGKAYHFPEGAYVEYLGTLEEQEREDLRFKLQNEVNRLIAENLPIHLKIVTYDELTKLAQGHIPDYIPTDKPSRVMIVNGYFAIPCGGTHVQSTDEVKAMTIEKVKNKSGNVRVSYSIIP